MNKENLQEWKQTLLQEIENLKARLAPIETEIRVKQEKLVAIDRLLNLETQPFEAIPALKNNSAARTTDKRKTADVAYEVLKNAGTPMHYRDLYEAILKTGFEVRGEDPAANLIAHISIDPRFKRVKRGTYALKGWRLGGRKQVRKKIKRRI
jgi:hypothetical protein